MSISIVNFLQQRNTTSTAAFRFVLPTNWNGQVTGSADRYSIYSAEFTISGATVATGSTIGVAKFLAHWKFSAAGSFDNTIYSAHYNVANIGQTSFWNNLVTSVTASTISSTTHRFIPVVEVDPAVATEVNWVIKGTIWVPVGSL